MMAPELSPNPQNWISSLCTTTYPAHPRAGGSDQPFTPLKRSIPLSEELNTKAPVAQKKGWKFMNFQRTEKSFTSDGPRTQSWLGSVIVTPVTIWTPSPQSTPATVISTKNDQIFSPNRQPFSSGKKTAHPKSAKPLGSSPISLPRPRLTAIATTIITPQIGVESSVPTPAMKPKS